ncbi:c-type cytochrome [Zoogloea sp.]|uniref:c-type cytochrome n=1 Tax=Zoogloea sp. TaxID=49181 RepID=UPI00262BB600|nr:c-type cytochrome [Zoogloea sp.]MDD3353542.1 cytochrome C [Zoogloea sp.]
MMLFRWTAALCLLGTLGVAQADARPDPNLARNLAATCANCHGSEGRSVPGSGAESLAGGDKDKLLQKLMDFRSGAKPATIMHQIAKGYSEAQLEQIAAYFAARK